MIEVKVTTVGNSAGVVLPKDALCRMGVDKGDRLFMVEHEEGWLLTAYDPAMKRQMAIAEEAMARFKNALHELAK